MKKVTLLLTLILLTAVLIQKEIRMERPKEPLAQGCLHCHRGLGDPDPSHPIAAFGCSDCHLGNPYALEEGRAHFGMVKNPGDLAHVEKSCGRANCHGEIVTRVKNSIMATNRGMLRTIQRQWLGREGEKVDVERLLAKDPPTNLAVDHYRKMCGGCHLWKKRGDLPGEKGRRGGGCSDCHILEQGPEKSNGSSAKEIHPRITTRIPSENCVKCHNRSGRIGLSYFGRFESAGYGTPFEGEELNSRRLSGGRFYLQLPSDVHHAKLDMDCVDCHTGVGVMGDGKRHEHMEHQTDISCKACHSPRFFSVEKRASQAFKLSFLNKKIPDVTGKMVATTKKGTPIYNLQRQGDKVLFYRKRDGKVFEMGKAPESQPYHAMKGHERLSCQSCHSAWIPQCYGCHLNFRLSLTQRDWLSSRASPGQWKEARSYMRFARPTLGVKDEDTVSVFSPCQVFVSYFDETDAYQPDRSFKRFTMSSFDPHTTTKSSRTCMDCHGNPKSLGLGEGRMYGTGEGPSFRATYDSNASGLGVPFPLDAFTDLEGRALHRTSREASRAFNKTELRNIRRVNRCVGCHEHYGDRIYEDFRSSFQAFLEREDLPCKR